MKGQRFVQRLGHAWRGLMGAVRQERSLRTHLGVLGVVIGVLGYRGASALWWALILLAAGVVLVAELLNTALEALADRLHPERHPEIGFAKDVAAGAVLMASLMAAAIGLIWLLEGQG
jgi:diacylglycerol kinase (ATP)